jgi:AraC-like DNA-binding protein
MLGCDAAAGIPGLVLDLPFFVLSFRHMVTAEPPYFSNRVLNTRRFWIPNQDLDARLGVLSGGYEHVASDYRIDRDGFPQPLLEFIAGGAGTLVLDGIEHTLAPGMLFAYGPGVPVRIATDPRSVLRKYFLTVTGSAVDGLLAAAHLAPGEVALVADPLPVTDILEQAIRWGQGNAPGRAHACAVIVEFLALRLAHDAVPAGDTDSGALSTFRRCRAAIEERFLEVRTQAGVAALCGVEPSYLCRLYRRFAVESPYQHLRRLRMHHALARLQAGGSVQTVAAEVGFGDAAHFSRAFVQNFGLPPSRARSSRLAT